MRPNINRVSLGENFIEDVEDQFTLILDSLFDIEDDMGGLESKISHLEIEIDNMRQLVKDGPKWDLSGAPK
jgi:predicted  nucleic acid-binding Zn-ribbon protein